MDMTRPLPTLPIELIRLIILAGVPAQPYLHPRDNFPSARYRARWLVRLSRVSRAWNDICSPLLWSEAIFELSREGEQARLDLFYAQLTRTPELGRRVKRYHWTEDLDQPAVERTERFLRSEVRDALPNLESVSCLAALVPPNEATPPVGARGGIKTFPRLKELTLVSWDSEPLDGIARQPDGSAGIDADLISHHFGGFEAVETLTLSFATIQFAHHLLLHTSLPWPNLKHLHLFGSYETKIAYLPPGLPSTTQPMSTQVEGDADGTAHSLLHAILARHGSKLESLSLNLDGDPTQLRVPFSPKLMELCPVLRTLSLDGASPGRALTSGHPSLRRLMLGHAAGHLGGRSSQERVDEVERLSRQLNSVLVVDVRDGDEGKVNKRPFPRLESVGFWSLDFREESQVGWNVWVDADQDEVRNAAGVLSDAGRIRLEDRFGLNLFGRKVMAVPVTSI